MVRPGHPIGRVPTVYAPLLRRMAQVAGVFVAAAALLLVSSPSVLAQSTGRITGVVTDSASDRPVGDVQVLVVGTRIGAVTDGQGRYTINAAPSGTRTIEARRIGYRATRVVNVTVQMEGTTTLNIRIVSVPLTLQAVVTTGVTDPTSGTRVPFTVGRIEVENIPVPSTNAIESIQGKVAAVTIVPPGQPGSGTNILLRSPTSINKSNAPLIVVDGVVQSTAFGAATADLEALDIQNIEIVKGAAAASLYGSRAQSGVIQITTKRGSNLASGSTRFTARSEWGNNDLAGQIDWARFHHYRTNASGGYVNLAGRDTTRVGRVAKAAHERFQDVVYRDQVFDQVDRFFDPGQFSKNSFNIAQNLGRTNWFLSLVNTREDGVVLGSGQYDQSDARLNLDHIANSALSISFRSRPKTGK